MPPRETYILILVSDRDDQQLTQPMIEELELSVPVRFAAGGDHLLATMEQEEPMLVLVDFNLKPDTGLDLLHCIRSRAGWQHIPVVLLGESVDAAFVRRCYAAGACSYVQKPRSLEGTRRVIGDFFRYWLQVAETPVHRAELNPVS